MRTRTLCIAVAVLALAGCDVVGDPGDEDGTAASMRWHDCPGDVAIMLTARHRCGTLTIPAPRSRAGSTLDLAVLQTWPETDVGAADEVAASVGFNFGEPSHTAGEMALLAERLGVPVVSIAPRGVGEPGGLSLDCPEADGLGRGLAAIPDPEGRPAFITAVKDCHDRLVADGVDLDTFGTDDMVEDLELLRDALDVPRWWALVTYGELSRVSHAYAAAYADRVRASVTDSPLPGHLDAFTAATPGTRSAIAALVGECRASARCLARYPDLDQAWRRALARTAQRPIVGTSDGGRVLVDAPKLLRAVRAVLGGDGAAAVSDLPRMIVTAAEGRLHPTLATLVTRDPGFCNGYRPVCTKPGFSLGAYLSQACPELAVEGPPADGDPTYAGVFADSPYVEACRVWDVDPLPLPPADVDVPTLALTGHLDSWSRPEWFADPVVVRGATHDVAGWSACAREVRNAWVSDPAAPADTGACLEAPLPDWD